MNAKWWHLTWPFGLGKTKKVGLDFEWNVISNANYNKKNNRFLLPVFSLYKIIQIGSSIRDIKSSHIFPR